VTNHIVVCMSVVEYSDTEQVTASVTVTGQLPSWDHIAPLRHAVHTVLRNVEWTVDHPHPTDQQAPE
jgi:hypothetical protein